MQIIIDTDNIFGEVNGIYLMECPSTKTTIPLGMLTQAFNEAKAKVIMILGRFYQPLEREQETADDSLSLSKDWVVGLKMTERRAGGKMQSLADAIHAFMVDAILAKIYSSIALDELNKKHVSQLATDAELLNTLIHSKRPPLW